VFLLFSPPIPNEQYIIHEVKKSKSKVQPKSLEGKPAILA